MRGRGAWGTSEARSGPGRRMNGRQSTNNCGLFASPSVPSSRAGHRTEIGVPPDGRKQASGHPPGLVRMGIPATRRLSVQRLADRKCQMGDGYRLLAVVVLQSANRHERALRKLVGRQEFLDIDLIIGFEIEIDPARFGRGS